MATRSYRSSTGNSHPVVEQSLELRDDGRFGYDFNEHSYDYSYTWAAEGRFEVRGDQVVLFVEATHFSAPPSEWCCDATVTVRFEGDDVVVDGVKLELQG